MARAFLLVMDSFGIGNAPDAEKFGDKGACTLNHIADMCASGRADKGRKGPLNLPFLDGLGLGRAAKLANGEVPQGLSEQAPLAGRWGCASEISSGKDTISGHWEMTGLPVLFDWGYFPDVPNCFPPDLVAAIIEQANLPGILGNRHSSGTAIIEQLGTEHIKTGKPICYTSVDSVFQIAAHEQHFGLQRLYDLCEIVRKLLDPLNIGRVIARPFIGDAPDNFTRTANRHDYAVPPTGETLLDKVVASGHQVHAIGKINDIFSGKGVSHAIRASGHPALMLETINAGQNANDGDLVFTNFVDFDMLYGHPRDVAGYAAALEEFDRMLVELQKNLKSGDLVVLTADHGNDPTWRGTDHTREKVPVLMFGPDIEPGEFGASDSFAVIGEAIAQHLQL